MTLLPQHLEELQVGSALNDETIRLAQFASSTDGNLVAGILGWHRRDRFRPNLPALVIPYFDQGRANGYRRIKFAQPVSQGRKYESPLGSKSRPYIPPMPALMSAIGTSGARIDFTEGEKKTLAANQAGVACIGLTGNWGWKVKSKLELLRELAEIDWRGRESVIWHDLDPTLSGGVCRGFSELGKVLADTGVRVAVRSLPSIGRNAETGLTLKAGIDDFIAATSEAKFRELAEAVFDGRTTVPLSGYRKEMQRGRFEIKEGEMYVDASPTGTSKTTSDVSKAVDAEISLVVTKTHKQGDEVVDMFLNRSTLAERYPALGEQLNPDDPKDHLANCQNLAEAEKAMKRGLSPTRAVCVRCKFYQDKSCEYHKQVARAKDSMHSVGTQARAEFTLAEMAKDKALISFQEDPVDLLALILDGKGPPHFHALEMASAECRGYTSDDDLRQYFWALESNAKLFRSEIDKAAKGIEGKRQVLDLTSKVTATATIPPRAMPLLLEEIERMRQYNFCAEVNRLCVAVTEGRCNHVIAYTVRDAKGVCRTTIAAASRTELPEDSAVLVSDATASPEVLQQVTSHRVIDITPASKVQRKRQVIQFPRSVRRGTTPAAFLGVVRAAMMLRPDCQRFGIITHRNLAKHLKPLPKDTDDPYPVLEPIFRDRIAKLSHFGGKDARGSNDWHEQCDDLLVIGTPRPGDHAVAVRLMQIGDIQALDRDPCWMNKDAASGKHKRHYWLAKTVSGKRRVIQTGTYADHEWRAAYESLCRAELVQAVGRARGVLDAGIDCYVFSCDDIGIPVADEADDLKPIGETHATVLECICRGVTKAADIAKTAKITPKYAEKVRSDLRKSGAVHNAGSHRKPKWEPVRCT